jgi:glycosyltransferase involved in cell wall biosynthesis
MSRDIPPLSESHFEKKGLVSVIIPSYNGELFIAEALESVATQTYPHWELIVVEDASHDRTENIVKAFRRQVPNHRVKFIRHSHNQGVSATRNTAIQASKGEWIAFLDHDDIWLSHHLEESHKQLEELSADLCFCDVERFEDSDKSGGHYATLNLVHDWMNRLFLKNELVLSSVVLRRRAMDSTCPFDTSPNLQHCEDYDLWLRLAEQGKKFTKVNKTDVRYRSHPAQATAKYGMMLEREYQVIKRRVASFPLPLKFKRHRCSELCLRTAMHYWPMDLTKSKTYLWKALCYKPLNLKLFWLWSKAWFC